MMKSDDIPPALPKAQKDPRKRKVALAVAVMLTIVVVISIAAIPYVFPEPEEQSADGLVTNLGLSVNQTSPGNWTIYIISGHKKASEVHLTVSNRTTGEKTLDKVVSKLAPAKNDPDAVYIDATADSKLNAGDTIILKASGGHIQAGYKVVFMIGQDVVGTIKELPAEVG